MVIFVHEQKRDEIYYYNDGITSSCLVCYEVNVAFGNERQDCPGAQWPTKCIGIVEFVARVPITRRTLLPHTLTHSFRLKLNKIVRLKLD